MPEQFRSLFWILALALPMFELVRRSGIERFMAMADFRRRRNLWITLTVLAFLSHNFWVFIGGSVIVLLRVRREEHNPFAMFLFVMAAVPPVYDVIPGFGLINYLFPIDHASLLVFMLLIPAWWTLRKQPQQTRWGAHAADWMVMGYWALGVALQYGPANDTFTNTLRHAFYNLTSLVLPYYVASRSLSNLRNLRDSMASFVIPALALAPLAVLEYGKAWLLYQPLPAVMGALWPIPTPYLYRGDMLRAVGPMAHSLVFGVYFTVAIGLLLSASRELSSKQRAWGFTLLAIGLAVTQARGPWMGCIVMVLTVIGLQRGGVRFLAGALPIAIIAGLALALTPFGAKLVNQLPFIGNVGDESVDYRSRLLQVSLIVFGQNPFFGSPDVLGNPLMQQMRQGEGLIDLVNVYLSVVLYSGIVGLLLYCGIFGTALLDGWRALRLARARSPALEPMAASLMGLLIGLLVTLATLSSILLIPLMQWTVVGMAVALRQIMRRLPVQQAAGVSHTPLASRRAPATAPRPGWSR